MFKQLIRQGILHKIIEAVVLPILFSPYIFVCTPSLKTRQLVGSSRSTRSAKRNKTNIGTTGAAWRTVRFYLARRVELRLSDSRY